MKLWYTNNSGNNPNVHSSENQTEQLDTLAFSTD